MKFLPIFVLFLTCLITKGSSESIQCYTCEDCNSLDDSLLQSCPAIVTTPSDTDTTTVSSSSSTDDSTSTTEAPTTEASTTTEAPTTTAPTAPTTTAPTAAPTAAPTSAPEAAGGAGEAAVAGEVAGAGESGAVAAVALTGGRAVVPQVFSRVRNIRSVLRADPSHVCFTVTAVDGDNRKVKKGCVEVPEEKSACDVLKDKYGTVENCWSCETDKCNSSAALKYSLVTLLMALVAGFLWK